MSRTTCMIVHTSNKLPWQWMKVFVLLFVCLLSFFSLQSTFFFYILFWHRFSINDKSWTVQILLTNKNYISLCFFVWVCACMRAVGGAMCLLNCWLFLPVTYCSFLYVHLLLLKWYSYIYIYKAKDLCWVGYKNDN